MEEGINELETRPPELAMYAAIDEMTEDDVTTALIREKQSVRLLNLIGMPDARLEVKRETLRKVLEQKATG